MHLEFIKDYGILLGYFAVCALSAFALRRFTSVPDEVFRKTLHIIVIGSVFVWVYAFETWWISAIAAILFILMVYPILAFAERIPSYSELLTERKSGEIKSSLVVVFIMFAVLICLCWGWIGEKYLIIASVLAWGLGDAALHWWENVSDVTILRGGSLKGARALREQLQCLRCPLFL